MFLIQVNNKMVIFSDKVTRQFLFGDTNEYLSFLKKEIKVRPQNESIHCKIFLQQLLSIIERQRFTSLIGFENKNNKKL